MIDGTRTFARESVMASKKYYRDFREHLKTLEERGKLIRIKREINKDTELMPLVRWQFRGLDEDQRKAFLFENVVDAKGKKYAMPVTVGTLAATTEIYAIGMMCETRRNPRALDGSAIASYRSGGRGVRSGSGSRMAGQGFARRKRIGHDSGSHLHSWVRQRPLSNIR